LPTTKKAYGGSRGGGDPEDVGKVVLSVLKNLMYSREKVIMVDEDLTIPRLSFKGY